MSQENVELVRRVVNTGNQSGWAGDNQDVTPFFEEGAVMHPFREWPGPSLYVGREGLRDLIREWAENFNGFRWELDRVIDAGLRVVALGRIGGESRQLGMRVDGPAAAVFHIAEDLISEVWFYVSWEEALEAAGLSE
jgi:ketosteroid isomerase-like protein